jgi:AraC-like DNA-binding protein
MYLSRLKALSDSYYVENKSEKQEMPGLSVFRRMAPSEIEGWIYVPALCLILQGSKVASTGDQTVEVKPGDALVVSHDLPVVSRITKASAQEPYLAVILLLDLHVLHSLYEQVAELPVSNVGARSMSTAPAEDGWLEPLVRYFEMMGSRADAQVLGPSTLREIYYRLLLSPVGAMLRSLLVAGGHASRIAKAIHQLRSEYHMPLTVPDLAKTAGMSASSFHEHFKAVTGTTPLQYQKDLRLIEAQAMLKAMNRTVSEAAYAVGYESPNHFSRDFSRKFGLPPSRVASAAEVTRA